MKKKEMEQFIIDNNIKSDYFVKIGHDDKPYIVDYECEESLFCYNKDEIILKDYATGKFKVVDNKLVYRKDIKIIEDLIYNMNKSLDSAYNEEQMMCYDEDFNGYSESRGEAISCLESSVESLNNYKNLLEQKYLNSDSTIF